MSDRRQPAATPATAQPDMASGSVGPTGVVVEVTDLVAGYLPGVNILNGANLDRPTRASSSASSARTAPASRRC